MTLTLSSCVALPQRKTFDQNSFVTQRLVVVKQRSNLSGLIETDRDCRQLSQAERFVGSRERQPFESAFTRLNANYDWEEAMPKAKRSKTSKRTVLQPHKGDRRYVRRSKQGKFTKQVDV